MTDEPSPPGPVEAVGDGAKAASPDAQTIPTQSINPASPGSQPGIVLPFMTPAPSMVAGVQLQVWQGQFPPPEAIKRYEQVQPGAFDRILVMAERQQAASITGAKEARDFLREGNRRGQWLGWSVTALSLTMAAVCAYLKQPVVATAIVAVPVMGVAKALIDSARSTQAPPPAPPTPPAGTTEPSSR